MKKVLITGVAGFIGYSVAKSLAEQGVEVCGLDNLNDYYDIGLKQARLAELATYKNFTFHTLDITDYPALSALTAHTKPSHILHLAAQAGVRYSLTNPHAYTQSNLVGQVNILEIARHLDSLEHLVYASSSSVYGDRKDIPFDENSGRLSPVSLYAATKISGELLAESYFSLYGLHITGLRFFTVYGPWGRPDMAYYIFTENIRNKRPLTLFAPDKMIRDFTYIDDIVEVMPRILNHAPNSLSLGQHAVYNLGRGQPRKLMDLVKAIETACGSKARFNIAEKQDGDVESTFADIRRAQSDFDYSPQVTLEDGIARFVKWHHDYTT